MNMHNTEIFPSADSLATAVADLVVKLSIESIVTNGKFTIALSGGTTPNLLFDILAKPPYANSINWKQTFVFWVDERYVAPTSPDNNAFQAKKLLLDHVQIPAENVFSIPVKMPAAKAAIHYEQTLKIFFKNTLPSFDLILLGMGEDGHTASLFPQSALLKEEEALIKSIFATSVKMERITFTPPLINNAKKIVFMVAGSNKASMLKTVLKGKTNVSKYPAQIIKGNSQDTLSWYLDEAAAAKLK